MTSRLNRSTPLPSGVAEPVQPTSVGILHLGVGAFHRAHQAVYTQEAMRLSGDFGWGILGVTGRSRRVADDLAPQDGLFSVLTMGEERSIDVVGSIVDVLAPSDDTAAILGAFASRDLHVVTITATESAYPVAADGGLDRGAVAADLHALADDGRGDSADVVPASSMLGMLVRGLAARYRAGGGSLTIISCDNIIANGRLLERLVRDAVADEDDGGALASWVGEHVTFPNTMVDRITPAPTQASLGEAAALLGAEDHGAVVAEPFQQWVIEDRFAGPRPPWELAGVLFTDDVAPYEELKLRLLNGTHSALAYAGAVRGCTTIDEAMTDPIAVGIAKLYLYGDAIPSTAPPEGIDIYGYADSLLTRFSNATLGHTVAKVSMDASLKIPLRWAPVAEARLRDGHTPHGVAAAFAMWIRFLRQCPELVHDPRRAELEALVASSETESDLLVAALQSGIALPVSIGDDERFSDAAHAALGRLPD